MNSLLEHPLVLQLGWTLLHSLWQCAAIALIFAAANPAARAARPTVRYAIACVCLATMAASPIATFLILRSSSVPAAASQAQNAPRQFEPITTGAAAKQADSTRLPAPTTPALAPEPGFPASPETPRADFAFAWQGIAVAIWLTGLLLLSARHLGGWLHLRSLRRTATAIHDPAILAAFSLVKERLRLNRVVQLLSSARMHAPAVVGFFAPAVLFPARALTGLEPEQVKAILAHELAHVRRADFLVNVLQCVLETILFYHPAVWWVSKAARREREFCADDLAIAAGNPRLEYAGALARLAELHEPALAIAATGGNLLERIQRIVGRPAPRNGRAATALTSLITAGLVAGALLLSRSIAQDARVIEVKAGESLQTAIEAAPEGAVIRVGEGEFVERIRIAKRLTLEGAGWEKTRIVLPKEDDVKRRQHEEGAQAAKTPQEREALIEAARLALDGPTLFVAAARDVSIRGLRVTAGKPDAARPAPPLAQIRNAQARIEQCAFTGPGQDGLHIGDSSNMEIANCLVAGLWGEGIVISGASGRDPKVVIRDSDIRNIHHYAVQIGRGCDRVSILRCRISGAAWHGIRYDSASPLIEGNLIFAHARSGIYASGRTRATVRNNLFFRNEMSGVSCWFDNQDLIEGNTFAANQREALAVLGASKPKVRSNIFWSNPVAVSEGRINNDAANAKGAALLENNVFWKNDKNRPEGEKDELPENTRSAIADPGFANADNADFQLTPESASRRAGAGATTPLALASPWPILQEEKDLIPEGPSRDTNAWKKPGGSAAPKMNIHQRRQQLHASVAGLVKDALQIDDAEKRAAAVEKMRAKVASKDDSEAAAGLAAYISMSAVNFDKKSFREILLAKLNSEDPFVRSEAIGALNGGAGTREDLERIRKLSKDNDAAVREAVAWSLVWLSGKDLTGPEEATWLELFDSSGPDLRKEMLRGLWGVKTSASLQEKLVQLSRENAGMSYDILYFALSTSPNKQAACITRLIEYLAHEDSYNVGGRAAWGLAYGIESSEQGRVADAMLKVYVAREPGYLRSNALDCLSNYASAQHLPELEKLAAKPGIAEDDKKKFEQMIARVKQKK